jgi:hypothetical protein
MAERLSQSSGIMAGTCRSAAVVPRRIEEVAMREGRPKRIIESLQINAP